MWYTCMAKYGRILMCLCVYTHLYIEAQMLDVFVGCLSWLLSIYPRQWVSYPKLELTRSASQPALRSPTSASQVLVLQATTTHIWLINTNGFRGAKLWSLHFRCEHLIHWATLPAPHIPLLKWGYWDPRQGLEIQGKGTQVLCNVFTVQK